MAQSQKEFFTRIQHKHDIEANWIKAVNFIPLNGEIIVYDKDDEHDSARIKIGDGTTKINELPFTQEESNIDAVTIDIDDAAEGTAMGINADQLGGYAAEQFLRKDEEIDADTFNNHTIDYFITRSEVGNILSDAMLKTGGEFIGNVSFEQGKYIDFNVKDGTKLRIIGGTSTNRATIRLVGADGTTISDIIQVNTETGAITASSLMPKTGGNFSGTVKFNSAPTIYRETSIANNYPAQLNFVVKQTDNNIETSASIAVYDDHDEGTYGTNMVIQSKGNMVIGSGESPTGYYQNSLLDNTSEKTYIVSDNNINFIVNANTLANAKSATINTDGGATFAGNVIVGNANSTTDRTRNIECWNAGKTARVSTNRIVMVRK